MPAPRKTTKLKAPAGTDEVNVGETRIPVTDDGTVDVPNEAVESLTSVGGCSLADVEIAPVPDGHVEVEHDDPDASLSFGGESYGRDEDGRMFVPLALVPHLLAHGFRLVPLEVVAAKLHSALAADGEGEPEAEPAADPAPAGEGAEPAAAEAAGAETPAA